jgi:hypothetical protein
MWQLKEAIAYQRHHIPQRLATGAWRDFIRNKIARLPYVDPSTEYARARSATCRCRTQGREQRTPGCGRAAGTPQPERFARRERSGHA